MSVLRRKKAAQSQDRASCNDDGGALLRPLAKPVKPSDDALMRGGLRLRKFVLFKIADLLIAKFSADAVAVRRYGKSGLALNLLRSRCVLR